MKNKLTIPVFTILILLLLFPLNLSSNKSSLDLKKLDQLILKSVKEFDLVGLSIAVIKDQKILFQKGYGSKNKTISNDKITKNSLFNIASCSKAFTAAAIGILVQQGKITWDDRVIKYIPEFKLKDYYISKELTIRDTLSHRSGLGTFDGDLLWYETSYSDMDIISRLKNKPIRYSMRSKFGYQNCMYIVAGEIIKRVTGKSWADFIRDNVFEPLEMNSSWSHGHNDLSKINFAMPHIGNTPYPRYISRPNAAASIFSSTNEMSKWILMLLNNGKYHQKIIIKPYILNELFSPHTILNVSNYAKKHGTNFKLYGLGWRMMDYYGTKVIEHSGGMPGYISKVVLVPSISLGFVILTNNMNSIPSMVGNIILDSYIVHANKTNWFKVFKGYKDNREKYQKKSIEKRLKNRKVNTVPSLKLNEYLGDFEDRVFGSAKIEMKNNSLHCTLLPSREIFSGKMKHWHYNTFRVDFKDPFLPYGLITFNLNSQGKIISFTIDLPSGDFHFQDLEFLKFSKN